MWYRTSALGVATLPKFAQEIVEAVSNAFEPISLAGDKCPSCKSSLQNMGDIKQQQFLESRKKYEDSNRSLGASEEEIQNALIQFDDSISDLKKTKFCQQCGASTNKFAFQINFSDVNKWFYQWSINLPDSIRDDESLLGDFLKNSGLNLEEKIFEVSKRLQFLRFIQELDPDKFGTYNWTSSELALRNTIVNSRQKEWMLQTLRHELGHLFSLDKKNATTNVMYDQQQIIQLFDKIMYDYNIQINSLNDLKSLSIEELISTVQKYKNKIFPNIQNESGLDNLLAKLSKSLLVNSKKDLLYGNDYSGSYSKQYSYYIYMTSEIETPTVMSDLVYFFNENNLEAYRKKNFKEISQSSYCNYLKDIVREWNRDKLLTYIESVLGEKANIYGKYADFFYTSPLDDRPRIMKFTNQLQKNLVIKVNNYCSASQENQKDKE
jgi:hypothetical protein